MSGEKRLTEQRRISYNVFMMKENINTRFRIDSLKEQQVSFHHSQSPSLGWGLRFLSSWITSIKRSSWQRTQHNKTVQGEREQNDKPVPAGRVVKASCDKRLRDVMSHSKRHCNCSFERTIKFCTDCLRFIRGRVYCTGSGAVGLTDLRHR